MPDQQPRAQSANHQNDTNTSNVMFDGTPPAQSSGISKSAFSSSDTQRRDSVEPILDLAGSSKSKDAQTETDPKVVAFKKAKRAQKNGSKISRRVHDLKEISKDTLHRIVSARSLTIEGWICRKDNVVAYVIGRDHNAGSGDEAVYVTISLLPGGNNCWVTVKCVRSEHRCELVEWLKHSFRCIVWERNVRQLYRQNPHFRRLNWRRLSPFCVLHFVAANDANVNGISDYSISDEAECLNKLENVERADPQMFASAMESLVHDLTGDSDLKHILVKCPWYKDVLESPPTSKSSKSTSKSVSEFAKTQHDSELCDDICRESIDVNVNSATDTGLLHRKPFIARPDNANSVKCKWQGHSRLARIILHHKSS